MTTATNKMIDFFRYPPVGGEDWQYAYPTARVRVLELSMVPRATFVDMANAGSFAEAVEFLAGTEYTIDAGADSAHIEEMLLARRSETRRTFVDLMIEDGYTNLLRAREDYANMRLAVRRVVTERPMGLDYSNEGNVLAEEFEEIFEQESYSRFPGYLQDGVEKAVLGYYENKDIRMIDLGIDQVEAEYHLTRSLAMGSEFCESLARLEIDLGNIRTLLRLRMAESEDTKWFIGGGYIGVDRYSALIDAPFDTIVQVFAETPYGQLVEAAVAYLKIEKSFLALERECEDLMMGFLKQTRNVAAGHQPLIAWLLMKEAEIRNMRMVLSGKKSQLSSKLMLDRLGNWM